MEWQQRTTSIVRDSRPREATDAAMGVNADWDMPDVDSSTDEEFHEPESQGMLMATKAKSKAEKAKPKSKAAAK